MEVNEIRRPFDGGMGRETLAFLPVLSCQAHFPFQVAIRKQEIEDRLNSWVVFNEKNKELCAWLAQMENRVLQTADVSIEEMVDKLQKVSSSHLSAVTPPAVPPPLVGLTEVCDWYVSRSVLEM